MSGALPLILLANFLTFAVCAAATLRRPILSYFLVTGLAFVATGCALWQLITGSPSILSSISTLLLLVTIVWRAILNATDRAKVDKDRT